MGYEYRLLLSDSIDSLERICKVVASGGDWELIPSSLEIDAPAVGVQTSQSSGNPEWPHVADLVHEGPQRIYALCHTQTGVEFVKALKAFLEVMDLWVVVSDDV